MVYRNYIKIINDHLNIPMYSILGNHDYHKDPRQQIIYNKHNWNMPYYYYYKEYPNYKNFERVYTLNDDKLIALIEIDDGVVKPKRIINY